MEIAALDRNGKLYTAGSTGVPVAFSTPGAYQPRYGGGDTDGFVTKMDLQAPDGPTVSCVGNAASLLPGLTSYFPIGTVAPGERISILGARLGASRPRVLFDGMPASLLYTGNDQINAVAPFGVEGTFTKLTIELDGRRLGPYELPVNDTVPAIFTLGGSGIGQGAILNQDYTINSPANPAARGSVVMIFATGAGRMDPPQKDGEMTGLQLPLPRPRLGVSVLIGSHPAEALYAGAAPGLVAGVLQVNARIPEDLVPSPFMPISIHVGNYASQFSVTMAVKSPTPTQ